MSSPVIVGRPGGHARRLRTSAGLLTVASGAGILAGAAGVVTFLSPFDTVLVAASSVVAVVSGAVFSAARSRFARAAAGVRAEVRVARVLRRLPVAVVAHGVPVAGLGDADHVVLGPVAAVIETKHGHGRVSVVDGAVFAGRRRLAKDPVGQAQRVSARVGQTLAVPVTPIVVVSNGTGEPVRSGNVWVTGPDHLATIIGQLPRVATDADRLRRRLPR